MTFYGRPSGVWYRIEKTRLGTWNVIEEPYGMTIGCYREVERARARVPATHVLGRAIGTHEEYREPVREIA